MNIINKKIVDIKKSEYNRGGTYYKILLEGIWHRNPSTHDPGQMKVIFVHSNTKPFLLFNENQVQVGDTIEGFIKVNGAYWELENVSKITPKENKVLK